MHPILRDGVATEVSQDFIITVTSSFSTLITPLSKEGRDWCWEHMELDDYPGERASISVPRSEISDVVNGMLSDGMRVQWTYK
jgi:hypothetical protein